MEYVIGREKQLRNLNGIIENAVNFTCIVVHGPPSSGKTLVLNHVLNTKKINHVHVDCRCISSVKQFYDVLLNRIYEKFDSNYEEDGNDDQKKNNESSSSSTRDYKGWRNKFKHKKFDYKHCKNAYTFARIVQYGEFSKKKSFYIVLDHFQRLMHIEETLISALLQTQEMEELYRLHKAKIGCILVDDSSCMVDIKKLVGNKYHIVYPVYFEQYNNKQIESILMSKAKDIFKETNLSQKECEGIVRKLVSTFIYIERRVDHFCQYLAMLMPDIMSISNKSSNINKSNRNDQIHRWIMALYDKVTKSKHGTFDFMSSESLTTTHKIEQREPDLPYASKLLMLAAYLASFNTCAFNQAQFCSYQKRRSKVKKSRPRTKDEWGLMLRGPRTFNLRDLSGIFITLFKRNAPSEYNKDLRHINDIRYQISHLISLNFITNVSKEGLLDDAKFQCNIEHEYATFIARKIGIEDWVNYLESGDK